MKLKINYLLLVLPIILVFIISGCVQQTERESNLEESSLDNIELGNFCRGEAECNTFCHDNKGRCKDYCENNTNNKLCQKIGFADKICDDEKVIFDYAPVNLDKTIILLPLGLMAGGHVTPVDHHYFQNFDNKEFNIEIYSPGEGIVTSIQHMPGAKEGEDYRIVIDHSCSVSSIYIHIGILSEKLKQYAPSNNKYVGVKVPVEAGEILGYYMNNVDYSIADTEVILPGLLIPEHYDPETWKIHTANIYDYFNEPIKNKLIEKSLRTAEPINGKIDYDIEGKLSGNWFLQGSNGYFGTEKYGYWQEHLAIAYDYFDPERVVFSIANYDEKDSHQFGVKGNSPNPSEIGVDYGLIKYELVEYDYITPNGNPWDRKSLVKGLKTKSTDIVQGVLLVQVLDNKKIKLETFPGKTASQVNGFSDNAKIYER